MDSVGPANSEGRPGVPQQALESANRLRIPTLSGLVDALLQLIHRALELLPGQLVPSIHRGRGRRAHSLWTATHPSTFHGTGSPSAYPQAFPGAFASETIPLLSRMRATPTRSTVARTLRVPRAPEELLRSGGWFAVEGRASLFAGSSLGYNLAQATSWPARERRNRSKLRVRFGPSP